MSVFYLMLGQPSCNQRNRWLYYVWSDALWLSLILESSSTPKPKWWLCWTSGGGFPYPNIIELKQVVSASHRWPTTMANFLMTSMCVYNVTPKVIFHKQYLIYSKSSWKDKPNQLDQHRFRCQINVQLPVNSSNWLYKWVRFNLRAHWRWNTMFQRNS